MGQQNAVLHGRHLVRCRLRQRLALSLPAAEERRRCLPHTLLDCELFNEFPIHFQKSQMMVVEGIPLFLIELGIGQRLRTGPIGVWNAIHPYLGGVGVSAAVVSFLVGLYYNVILTWVVYYLFQSIRFELPWSVRSFRNKTRIITLFPDVPFTSQWLKRDRMHQILNTNQLLLESCGHRHF